MFNDLDTRDEADMLGLAIFMQTLLDAVPSTETLSTSLQVLLPLFSIIYCVLCFPS